MEVNKGKINSVVWVAIAGLSIVFFIAAWGSVLKPAMKTAKLSSAQIAKSQTNIGITR